MRLGIAYSRGEEMSGRKVVLSWRLEPEYADALTKVAEARGMTRSQLLREFAANAESFYRFLESERVKQQSEAIALDGNLSRWVLDHIPKDMRPEWLEFLGDVMRHAAQMKRVKEAENGRE